MMTTIEEFTAYYKPTPPCLCGGNGTHITHRGESVACHCDAPLAVEARRRAASWSGVMRDLGMVATGKSIVQPWQDGGRTALIGGGQ